MPIFAFSHRRAQEQYAVRRCGGSLAQFSDSPPHTRFIESPARLRKFAKSRRVGAEKIPRTKAVCRSFDRAGGVRGIFILRSGREIHGGKARRRSDTRQSTPSGAIVPGRLFIRPHRINRQGDQHGISAGGGHGLESEVLNRDIICSVPAIARAENSTLNSLMLLASSAPSAGSVRVTVMPLPVSALNLSGVILPSQ